MYGYMYHNFHAAQMTTRADYTGRLITGICGMTPRLHTGQCKDDCCADIVCVICEEPRWHEVRVLNIRGHHLTARCSGVCWAVVGSVARLGFKARWSTMAKKPGGTM